MNVRPISKLSMLVPALVAVPLAISTATVMGVSPAQAQLWWDSGAQPYAYRDRVRARAAKTSAQRRAASARTGGATAAARPETTVSPRPASGPLLAVVSLANQRMSVYDSSGQIIRTPISSGTPSHRTPTGIFSIIQKNKFHRSNIYSGAPMPFMQRITWSGIALHAGALPGYPASHGCIRLPHDQASRLFAMSRMGMRVVVAPFETPASAFSHAALPVPVMVSVPAGAGAMVSDKRAEAASPIRLAATEGAGIQVVPPDANAPPATRLLNPVQRAQLARTQAKADAVASIQIARLALEASQRASAEANQAIAQLQAATSAQQTAALRLASAKAAESSASADIKATAIQAREDAERRFNELSLALTEAKATEAVKTSAAFAAAVASREADEAIERKDREAKAAERAVEPIHVFISRKEGKLYVRQGYEPLFDVRVTFKSPTTPVGTHVYQAMSADDGSGQIGWMVVSVPSGGGASVLSADREPVRRGVPAAAPVEPIGPMSNAGQALDRVEIPDDAKQRIAERLWLNSSLIISDYGVSNETGKGTDHIILTR